MANPSSYPASTCRSCGAICSVRPGPGDDVMHCVLCGAVHELVMVARR